MRTLPLLVLALPLATQAFVVPTTTRRVMAAMIPGQRTMADVALRQTSANEEAAKLLERARKMREELAVLTGQSVEELEQEAAAKKQLTTNMAAKAATERELRKKQSDLRKESSGSKNGSSTDGKFLTVPETPDDQIWQAKAAVERAFAAGVTRQIVRFALVPEGETLNQEDRQWPGGAQQMYREAAGPLTRELLKQIRAPTKKDNVDSSLTKQPPVQSQDIWDFDGSALITAEAANASADVRAMVQPNTDNKYTSDIVTIDKAMGERLFLLVNPFWRDITSWGFNLLAPGAKEKATAAIFDRGFQETYCVLQKSVRGEDCVALKAYPYDWQLYAYAESDYWPYSEYSVHLGSTTHEPKSVDFAELLSQRDEFKLSKNMRQMQRLMNKNE